MKIRFCLLALQITFSVFAYAQTGNVQIEWHIENTSSHINGNYFEQKVLGFKNHTYNINQHHHAVFSQLFTCSQESSIHIHNERYESLNENELKLIDPSVLPEKIIHTKEAFKSRSKNFVYLEFVPLRKNSGNGKVEKLVSFSYQISTKPVAKKTKNYKSVSILKNGKWVKFKINRSGVYKVSYETLHDLGFENPGNISMWGSFSGQLSYLVNDSCIDDLEQIAIHMNKGNDNIFNAGDYILFYAQNSTRITFNTEEKNFVSQEHDYTDEAHYFFTDGVSSPKRITKALESNLLPELNLYDYNDFYHHEKNDTNLIGSGREWYGEVFDAYSSRNFNINLEHLITSKNILIDAKFAARAFSSTSVSTLIDMVQIGRDSINPASSAYAGVFARSKEMQYTFSANSENINLQFVYNKYSSSDKAWLDYFTLSFYRKLAIHKNQLFIINHENVSKTVKYHIEKTNESFKIWNISDPYTITETSIKTEGNFHTFISESKPEPWFILFKEDNYLGVEEFTSVENQDIHGSETPNYLIITHPDFLNQAIELAEFHEEKNKLTSTVYSTEQVYNEFSSGSPDASAIRNLCKYYYDKNPDVFRYLLLFGDGSYDNRKSTTQGNTNFIPTYQTENSLNPISSFVSDDFFGLLDENEGEYAGLLDIGIGRLPAKNSAEGAMLVSKIKSYYEPEYLGSWTNDLTFIADDEDYNIHINQANNLCNQVNENHPEYNIQKIYLDAYPQLTTSAGEKYPDVNKAITDKIEKGSLIFNYTGHGSEKGLAHEKIITIDDILSWKNNKLPLFITATCEFSRFDDPESTSAGELVLLNNSGGGIALLSTSRLVYSSPNYDLNKSFYKYAFEKNSLNEHHRLGDLIRLTKTDPITGVGSNKRNFTLLGDPAVSLHYPEYSVKTTKINNIDLAEFKDTIRAFDKVTLEGYIANSDNSIIETDAGNIAILVYDKALKHETLDNDNQGSYSFFQQNNILFRGKASLNNGRFSIRFVVPKDINYTFGKGKISYFTKLEEKIGSGYFSEITIGGSNPEGINDDKGPEIELFLNDENFVSGGFTNENPYIFAKVSDENGINTTGSSIGHDITAIIDEKSQMPIILNEYYEADVDSYQSGKIKYKLNKLENGPHTLTLKVWDIANNSTEEQIEFVVQNSASFELKNVLNYPNPFTEQTGFYFEHNQEGLPMEVLIQIFTVSGKLVKSIERSFESSGNRIGPIYWNGLDDFGDKIGRGIYLYRVKVRCNNQEIEKIEKLVILK